jgi:hypothetical protein
MGRQIKTGCGSSFINATPNVKPTCKDYPFFSKKELASAAAVAAGALAAVPNP